MKCVTALFFAMVFSCALAWSQASVPESEESASIYVSTAGSDSNAGTEAKPFRTIAHAVSVAVANNKKDIGTQITVLPGTYRESITVEPSGLTNAPITLEGATAGTVTISGADVWTGWKTYSNNLSIFTHSWPYAWGLCPALTSGPYEQAIVRRKELIFVNGTMLTEVLRLWDMHQGTFYVNQSNQTVYVWPPSGTNMATATVEVGDRPSLFVAHGVKNWVLRNLTFQYAPGCRQTDAAVSFEGNSSNILVDADQFNWNGDTGLSLGSVSYLTVESSEANHNGMTGFQGQDVLDSLWSNDQGSYNNWRGAQGAYYEWDDAGAKLFSMHTASMTGFQALFNLGKGIHFDTDNLNITIDSLIAANNLVSGAQIEGSLGPVSILSSFLCTNNRGLQPYDGGVNVVDASSVNLSDDTFYNNAISQILITGSNSGRSVTNYQTRATAQVYDQNLDLSADVVDGVGSNQAVFKDSYLKTEWSRFVGSLISNYNTWWNTSSTSAFIVPVDSGPINFIPWKSLTHQGSNSAWGDPSGIPPVACSLSPDKPDYWFLVNDASQSVSPGGSTSFVITVVPLGFSGTVSLSADWGQVPDASGSWSSHSITTSGSSTLTVKASSSTPAGTYPLTMIGTSGSLTRTVTVSVIVN